MGAYYNEHDSFAAAWLRALIADDLIAPGVVDERDIQDVQPGDIAGYDQHHFFAGIGGWSLALRLAGWPDDRPVWTGSCPCQPFSSAGKGEGFDDPRHLWPAWLRLIRECRPATIFGEQVASSDGLAWFDTVSTDLEAEAYAIGAADLCAAGVGAPHRRQRLWFVANAGRHGCGEREHARDLVRSSGEKPGHEPRLVTDRAMCERADHLALAHATSSRPARPERRGTDSDAAGEGPRLGEPARDGAAHRLDDSSGAGLEGGLGGGDLEAEPARRVPSPWRGDSLLWLPCRDGKARPTQPGLFPLAHGVSNRVGTLRGAGNAIVPQVAAEFIAAYREVTE